jgi:hypothetical protein
MVALEVDNETAEQVRQLAAERGGTASEVVAAALRALLHGHAGGATDAEVTGDRTSPDLD